MTTADLQIPAITPEMMELAIRLEGIFLPHARKQRDLVYRKHNGPGEPRSDATARFVHYTSAEAALNIIKTKRIWMRNTTCMSDYREVQHGFDILRKFFSDKEKIARFASALDSCVPSAAMDAINNFNQWWSSIQFDTYITSVSEHDAKEDLHGRLSMWRAFGGNAAHVAIVFKVPWFSAGALALNVFFNPVAYLTEDEALAQIYEVIENINANRDFLRTVDRKIVVETVFNMLLTGVTCLKHEGFREETEWRAIYSPKRLSSPLMEFETEVVGGVPQLVYRAPLDEDASPALASLDMSRVFDRLIIGPSPYPIAMYQAFVDALTKIKVPDPEKRVVASLIPIRS
jgi:Protein of unknown function (DUF2971)